MPIYNQDLEAALNAVYPYKPTSTFTGDTGIDINIWGVLDGTVSKFNVFGGGCEAAAGTDTDVWDDGAAQPVYPYPGSATMTHISTPVDDATMRNKVINIQGLDTNWESAGQNVTLDATNTTTAVALTTPLRRVFLMKVHTNVVAAQNIELHNAANTATYGVIVAGNNQSQMALYTVPEGKNAVITNYQASVVNETAANKTPIATEVKLLSADRLRNYEFQLKHATGIATQGTGAHQSFNPYLGVFSRRTDIRLMVHCIAEPGKVYAGFDIFTVDL